MKPQELLQELSMVKFGDKSKKKGNRVNISTERPIKNPVEAKIQNNSKSSKSFVQSRLNESIRTPKAEKNRSSNTSSEVSKSKAKNPDVSSNDNNGSEAGSTVKKYQRIQWY